MSDGAMCFYCRRYRCECPEVVAEREEIMKPEMPDGIYLPWEAVDGDGNWLIIDVQEMQIAEGEETAIKFIVEQVNKAHEIQKTLAPVLKKAEHLSWNMSEDTREDGEAIRAALASVLSPVYIPAEPEFECTGDFGCPHCAAIASRTDNLY